MCQKTEPLTTFETETCSRCGGSGHYSYCQMYGTTCFKCSGAKRVYTKRGAAAKQYFEGLCSKPASELTIGEGVFVDGRGCGFKSGFYLVESIEITPTHTNFQYKGLNFLQGVFPTTVMRVMQKPEEKQAKFQQALVYQNTLTKMGKPRVKVAAK